MQPSVMPSLSSKGWVYSTAEKADYLISHFFVSEYSQSLIYNGNVASFPWIIQKNQSDMLGVVRDLEITLELYFGRYFNNVVVQASYQEVPPNSGVVRIDLYVSFYDEENKQFSLSRVVEVVDSKIEKILEINNTKQM